MSKILANDKLYLPAKKIVTNMDGTEQTLSDTDAQKLQTASAFLNVRNITSACYSINRTPFTSVSPKPDWYDGLNGKFSTVKTYASQWLDNYSIAVASTIPSSIISFVPTFSSCARVINGIAEGNMEKLTPSQIEAITGCLSRILDKVTEIKASVDRYFCINEHGVQSGLLNTWSANMRDASNELESGNAAVQLAAADLAVDIESLDQGINALYLAIDQYNSIVCAGGGLVGGGAYIGAVGGAICLVNPIAGGITIFVGLATLISGATVWGVYQKKIDKAYKEIAEKKISLNAKTATLCQINSLSSYCGQVVNHANNALIAMGDFSTSWAVFGESIRQTIGALNTTEGSARYKKGLDVLVDFETADRHWNNVQQHAKDLVNSPSAIQEVDMKDIGKLTA